MKVKIYLLIATALPILLGKGALAQTKTIEQEHTLTTRWTKLVSAENALKEYPRPQMAREKWTNLNGSWDYAILGKENSGTPSNWDGKILVPYPLESLLSGVKKSLKPDEFLWYRRSFNPGAVTSGKHLLLHFGAVDYQAEVFVNGRSVGTHEGGYTAFSFDVTQYLKSGENILTVKVYDPSNQGIGPHGKQVLNPANIYYTPSSGIWQTVWLEEVPKEYINTLEIMPDIDRSRVRVKVNSASQAQVEITVAGKKVMGNSNTEINVPISAVHLWTPADPYLYDLTVKMGSDLVRSYVGMRKISVEKDPAGMERICLNGRPYFNLGTLDQGFWPDGLYTAPTDEALRFDIEAIKAMGFNTIRKHIKVEPARWYYWADKLGMLVWQDMVNPNQRLPEGSKAAFEHQSAEIISQLNNHPAITTWVLFNEKWGQYDQERLTKWLKSLDPSRLVNGHSGEYLYVNEKLRSPSPNAYVNADMTDVHAYPDPMISIAMPAKARVVGEFGGIGVFVPDHQWNTGAAWGYINEKPEAFAAKYRIMNQHLELLKKEGLSGSIYTQPFDVEGEQNGIMTYDREVIKIPFAELRKIHGRLNPDAQKHVPAVTAKDADLTEPAKVYADLLQKYLEGDKTTGLVKRLALMSAQVNDVAGRTRFGDEYISSLRAPYSAEDLMLISGLTKKVSDAGFTLMLERSATDRQTNVKVMNIIYEELIRPFVESPSAKPDWQSIESKVLGFGAAGEEIFLRAKSIHLLNQADWAAFVPVAKKYMEKYGRFISEKDKRMFNQALEKHQ